MWVKLHEPEVGYADCNLTGLHVTSDVYIRPGMAANMAATAVKTGYHQTSSEKVDRRSLRLLVLGTATP